MIEVVAAALVLRDQVLVAKRRARADLDENRWEFPGGKIEVGESPEEALKREILEELEVNIQGPVEWVANSLSSQLQIRLYVTEIQDQRWSLRDHDEVQLVYWKDLNQVAFLKSNCEFIAPLQDWFRKKGFK